MTPVKYVPHSWFGDLHGQKVLGLASGGGQPDANLDCLGGKMHSPGLYSDQQLESERLVAEHEGYDIDIVKAVRPCISRSIPNMGHKSDHFILLISWPPIVIFPQFNS
ncbi:hypothetical protein [Lactobacillus delbrueckii]|uniref:hypothetical protein n=1 Tax=Lactobacillus delbrueckii TaxID=1584 RepID=UPI001E4AD4A4|nr:hypothetical protein [Lactobacillus delbrueckii]MCD5457516.1 hypothetical protein [Lactobacillus delbrueckii subsp. bulgaricus]MCD5479901.1 hypothetical protein [Lactobacillus delbrueckii subsp. bulgaricus]